VRVPVEEEQRMSRPVQFYDDLSADYHLVYADWPASVRRQGHVLATLIREHAGADATSVLGCACRIGTQAIGLALEGFSVRGTDISAREVDRARREARGFGVDIAFDVADFRDLSNASPDPADVLICCDNSLPHMLTDDDIRQALRSMSAAIRPGGLLVIGIRDYDALVTERPHATAPLVMDRPSGRTVSFQVWDWSPDGERYDLSLFVVKAVGAEWHTQCHRTTYRALRRGELDGFLRDAGLEDVLWHDPADTGHHQPLVAARTSGECSLVTADPR
jgi:SAM-dependent methyltransferase